LIRKLFFHEEERAMNEVCKRLFDVFEVSLNIFKIKRKSRFEKVQIFLAEITL
jgi:hypothetical protein